MPMTPWQLLEGISIGRHNVLNHFYSFIVEIYKYAIVMLYIWIPNGVFMPVLEWSSVL